MKMCTSAGYQNVAVLGIASQSQTYVGPLGNMWGTADKAIDGNRDTTWKSDERYSF